MLHVSPHVKKRLTYSSEDPEFEGWSSESSMTFIFYTVTSNTDAQVLNSKQPSHLLIHVGSGS